MKNGKLWTGFSDWPYQRERTHTTQSLSMNRICSFWVLFAKIYALIHTTTHNRRLTANKIRLKFFHVFLFVRLSFNCSPTRIEISICCFALRQQNVSEWIHFAFFFDSFRYVPHTFHQTFICNGISRSKQLPSNHRIGNVQCNICTNVQYQYEAKQRLKQTELWRTV